jgi:hypothetical protein
MYIQWMVHWWVPVLSGPPAVPKQIMFLQTQKPHLSIVHILIQEVYVFLYSWDITLFLINCNFCNNCTHVVFVFIILQFLPGIKLLHQD